MAEELGKFVQMTREKRGMSQAELAEKMNVPIAEATVGKIEQGAIEVPSMPTLKALASALGVSLSSLTSRLPAGAEPAETFAPSGQGREKEVVLTTGTGTTASTKAFHISNPESDETKAEKFVGSATSFDELEDLEMAQEVVDMAHKMARMVVNIAHNPQISDKGGAVFELARQFTRRINPSDDKSATEIVDQVKHFEDEMEWEGHWSKAVWSTAFVNDLPDGNFLFIAPGGTKDSEGKTTPRRLRFFPYKDKSGAVDLPHLRNAIARIPQAKHPALTAEKKQRLQEKARGILAKQSSGKEKVKQTFQLLKQADGSYRWLAIYSNNFRDQDHPPEIISAASHERFVKMVDDGLTPMPELWYWHVPGTRWGVADMVAYDDRGFALATGTVDKGKEQIAENVANRPELGVSHGMPPSSILRDEVDPSIIVQHITREISPLPMSAAANKLTGFELLQEAKEMAVPKEKADELAALGFDVSAIDENIKARADQAEAEQLQAKQSTPETQSDPDPQPEPETEKQPEPDTAPEPEPVAAASESVTRTEITDLAKGIAEAIKSQGDLIAALAKEVGALKEAQNEGLAKQLEQLPGASLADLFAQKAFGQNGEDVVHPSTEKKEGPDETKDDKSAEGPTHVPFLNQFITGADQRRQ